MVREYLLSWQTDKIQFQVFACLQADTLLPPSLPLPFLLPLPLPTKVLIQSPTILRETKILQSCFLGILLLLVLNIIAFSHLHNYPGQQIERASTTHPGSAKSGGFLSTGASTPPSPTSSSSLSSSPASRSPPPPPSTLSTPCWVSSSPPTA